MHFLTKNAFLGDECLSTELRLRTIIELVAYCEEYEANYRSNNFTELCGVSIQETIHCVAVNGGLASVWAMCALASVLQGPIVSVYPISINGEADVMSKVLNVTLDPRVPCIDIEESVYIMWTSLEIQSDNRIWRSNHFVPLIKTFTALLSEPTQECDDTAVNETCADDTEFYQRASVTTNQNCEEAVSVVAELRPRPVLMKTAKGNLSLGHNGYTYRFVREGIVCILP